MSELTEAQIEMIAERAAAKAIKNLYTRIGESVAKKVFWFIGLAFVAMLIWAAGGQTVFHK